ncbi:hypothetical protein AB205_0122720 [Aquarana catesbeiana]|uniref:Uncharacterized protein n=1 Tax=Aquarana catesbeiana TaxID=8400 RepID=A0A2G9RT42_AQUCT|nr:hypothetical protein AB205_0122720 [Aquarana catesbeiana]
MVLCVYIETMIRNTSCNSQRQKALVVGLLLLKKSLCAHIYSMTVQTFMDGLSIYFRCQDYTFYVLIDKVHFNKPKQ